MLQGISHPCYVISWVILAISPQQQLHRPSNNCITIQLDQRGLLCQAKHVLLLNLLCSTCPPLIVWHFYAVLYPCLPTGQLLHVCKIDPYIAIFIQHVLFVVTFTTSTLPQISHFCFTVCLFTSDWSQFLKHIRIKCKCWCGQRGCQAMYASFGSYDSTLRAMTLMHCRNCFLIYPVSHVHVGPCVN